MEMIEQTLEDWKEEGKRLFGEDVEQHVFKCPKCGKESRVGDFKAYTDNPSDSVANCIGRYNPDVGCDWGAYGLFGTMGKGRIIHLPNGNSVEVFDFGGCDD